MNVCSFSEKIHRIELGQIDVKSKKICRCLTMCIESQGVTRGLGSRDNQGLNQLRLQKNGVSVQHPSSKNMLPQFYQKVLATHLSPAQYLTLQLLILLVQSHRCVCLSQLAHLFPQPIKYESRRRNLQRFLNLPTLSAKLLWFPIIKQLLKQHYRSVEGNRFQRRRAKKLKLIHQGYLLLVLDRTQWKDRNLIMLSLVWGQHALPVYWELLPNKGSSNLAAQKKVLAPVLRILRCYPVVLLGDREFHSVQLASWLQKRNVDFALRQKKGTCIADDSQIYQALKDKGIQPGQSEFFREIYCTKTHQLGTFNLAAYWQRPYGGRGPKSPWYILTSLKSLKLTLSLYKSRWGIEALFRDCKSGGYNLEKTQVNEQRLLAVVLIIAIAYSLATVSGESCRNLKESEYIGRPREGGRSLERQSVFTMGLQVLSWIQSLEMWSDLVEHLLALKTHKRLHFQQGQKAISLIKSTL